MLLFKPFEAVRARIRSDICIPMSSVRYRSYSSGVGGEGGIEDVLIRQVLLWREEKTVTL